MMNNRFGFREIIAQFDNATNVVYKSNKDDDDSKKTKKSQMGKSKKPQPQVTEK